MQKPTETATLAGSTVMVTGGCGFIGSHLVRALLERGAKEVRILDSLRYGDPANLGDSHPALRLTRHTLGTDDPAVLAAELTGVDYLFHLAAEKHNQSKESPQRVFRANIEGTHELLQAAADAGVRKVVFSSSLYAYGRMHGAPFREDEVPRPTTVYGISKLAGEHLCAHFFATRGLAYNTLRYLFVYGPRQFAGMGYKSVIMKNAEQLLAGAPLTIYGDGSQTLDYVFVDDVVDATLRAMETHVSGETLNIGSGQGTPVLELLETLALVAGRSRERRFLPEDWTAGTCRVADAERAERILGWRATTPLAEGLRRTWEFASATP